ncbi:hypothetical protein CKF46_37555, partial [Klebsiella pneumoniae]
WWNTLHQGSTNLQQTIDPSMRLPLRSASLPSSHYSVYWWNTLHQGSTNLQQTIDPSMRLPLRSASLPSS